MKNRDGTHYKKYLSGDLQNKERVEESVAAWRKTVPFTDEQIIAALNEYADILEPNNTFFAMMARKDAERVRTTGRLSARILSKALGFLVKTCAVCGKKALYRKVYEGRCSKHRDVKCAAEEVLKQRYEAKTTSFLQSRKERTENELAHKRLAKTAKFGGYRRPK